MAVDQTLQINHRITWGLLPYEALRRIYEYLNKESIEISTVCKHWRSVQYTIRLFWYKLYISPKHLPSITQCDLTVPPLQIVENLTLEFYPNDDNQLNTVIQILLVLKNNYSLKQLSIRPLTSNNISSQQIKQPINKNIKKLIVCVTDVIKNAVALQHFDWGSGCFFKKFQRQILKALKSKHNYNLESLGILTFDHGQFVNNLLRLNCKLFVFYNLYQVSINYHQLSEEILQLFSYKLVNLNILKLFVQRNLYGIPSINNNVWLHLRQVLPSLKVHIYFICINDFQSDFGNIFNVTTNQQQQQQSSFSFQQQIQNDIEHNQQIEQQKMNYILTNYLLPLDLPLSSIYCFYCKPNPLFYFVQYIVDHFSLTLEAFYLVDSFQKVPNTLIDPNNNNLTSSDFSTHLNNVFSVGNEKNYEEDYHDMVSPHSSYHSFEISDLETSLSCDSHEFLPEVLSPSTLFPSASVASENRPNDYNITCSGNISSEYNVYDEIRSPIEEDLYLDSTKQFSNEFSTTKRSLSSHNINTVKPSVQNLLWIRIPNFYKPIDDTNPDPFVMLAWRCKQLSHFSLLGYWLNISDLKAFTVLRGSALKHLQIPHCCISMDDHQLWSTCLNDDEFNEMSTNLGYHWYPLNDSNLPANMWSDGIPDPTQCFDDMLATGQVVLHAIK